MVASDERGRHMGQDWPDWHAPSAYDRGRHFELLVLAGWAVPVANGLSRIQPDSFLRAERRMASAGPTIALPCVAPRSIAVGSEPPADPTPQPQQTGAMLEPARQPAPAMAKTI